MKLQSDLVSSKFFHVGGLRFKSLLQRHHLDIDNDIDTILPDRENFNNFNAAVAEKRRDDLRVLNAYCYYYYYYYYYY